MIISANTPEGAKAKIFDKEGNQIQLPIKSYDTETKKAEVYELDENGKVVMTEWKKEGKDMKRAPVIKTITLDDSYAEIDGKRV